MDPNPESPDEDVLTLYDYDNVGRLTETIDPLGLVTRYVYHDADDQADEIIRNYDPGKTPYQDGMWNLSSLNYHDPAGRLVYTVTNALNWNGPDPDLELDLSGDGNPDYRLKIDPEQPEFNIITFTLYDAAGRVIETISNHWPGKEPYYQGLYNLSTRTFYDKAGRVAATVNNYYEADLPGGGAPEGMDFDGDGVFDAYLEINPDYPQFNRISQTSYDAAGRVSTTTQTAWPGRSNYYSPPGWDVVYNLVTAMEYDPAGNVIKTIQNFDDNNTNGFPVPVLLDPTGSPVTVYVDPDKPDRNQITCTQYDALNRPLFVRTACIPGQPDYFSFGENLYNLVTYYIYDEMGRQIASVRNFNDPGGSGNLNLTEEYNFITRNYYDGLGRVIYTVNNFVGDVSNPTVPVYDPDLPDRNLVTRYYYDAHGRQIAVVRNYWEPPATADGELTAAEIEAGLPDRNLVTRTYHNSRGLVHTTVTNFVGEIENTVPTSFDPQYPDRNLLSEFTYDILGRQIENKIERGTDGNRTNRNEYDLLGRLSRQVTNFVDGIFDPLITDEDLITIFEYDLLNRQVITTD
ncbi:MAG: hypothetical protein IBX69_16560, partial [Anaerolineales bacterium]|nr:hypothetical protein [Anaerolineales bacterium]